MADEDVDIRVRLKGARQAAGDAKLVGKEVAGIGDHTTRTGKGLDRYTKASGRAEKQNRKFGRSWVYARKGIGPLRTGVSGLAGALGFGAGVGLIGALKVMNDEARDAQKTNRATAQALKSTGAEAWTSEKRIYNLGVRLGELAAVDNQVVQKAENILLTFREIRNEGGKGNKIFDRTTKAALDMAAGMTAAGKAMSPTEAALQLGKAINDPVKGMTRLQRVGVMFTKQQTDQVKAMVKSGHTLAAQKVILNEVNKEFGGQARSQADPVKRLGVIFKDVAETLGLKLLPYVDKGAHKLGIFVKQVENGTGTGGKFRDTVERIWKAAKPVFFWFGRAAVNVGKFAAAHPDVVKIATALLIARKALNLMRFGPAISGAFRLWTWLGRAETRATTMPAKVSAKSGAWKAAGKLLGGVFVASFIAQLTGIEDADPLLFLHPPSAGGPKDEHSFMHNRGPSGRRLHGPNGGHGRVTGHETIGGVRYTVYADGTRVPTANVIPRSQRGPRRGAAPGHDVIPRRRKTVARGAGVDTTGDGGDTVIHNHIYLDGKEIATNTSKHVRDDRNRR